MKEDEKNKEQVAENGYNHDADDLYEALGISQERATKLINDFNEGQKEGPPSTAFERIENLENITEAERLLLAYKLGVTKGIEAINPLAGVLGK